MKKLALSISAALIAIGVVAAVAWPGPEPSVGLYWYETVDPTVGPGVCAPQWQLLIRTDVPTLYAHTGTSCTAWMEIAGGGGGGTVTSVACGAGLTCTPNPITSTGTVAFSSSGTTGDLPAWASSSTLGNFAGATGTACSAGQAVTNVGLSAAGVPGSFSCTAFTPGGSISGTTNTIAKFASSTTVGNSSATDDGTTFSVNAGKFAVTEATGNTTVAGALDFTASISPSAFTGGTVNDYNPAGLASTFVIDQSVTGATTITGLTAQPAGTWIDFRNTSASTSTLTFANASGSSLAANQFVLPGSVSWNLQPGNSFLFRHNGTNWRLISVVSTDYPFFTVDAQATLGNEALGILSPSAITGTVNDWSPTGWTGKTTTIVEVALSNTVALNGLVALNAGATVTLCNMSASFDLTINDENAGSTAANRFENQGGLIKLAHHTGPEPECASYYYSGSQSRWINRATTASTLHSLTLSSGLVVQSSGSTLAGGTTMTLGGGPFTSNNSNASAQFTATFDTTAGAVQSVGVNCSDTSTRSAGANNLTNICGQFTATGGQVNDAILTLQGNNVFNQTSGTSTFDGNLIMGAAGAIIQLIQISGSSATPKITAFAGNPNGTISGTAGDLLLDVSTPAIWQSTGGTGWAQGGGGGSVTGSGTSPDLTAWNGTNSVTNYAGSTASTCSIGQFVTAASLSAAGALTTTCASGGGAGTVTGSGTAGNLTEWLSSSAVQNAPITDDGAGNLATTDLWSAAALVDTGGLVLSGKTSDTSTGTVNNFNIPTGAGGTTVLHATPASAVTYTGFQCGGSTCTSANDGKVLIVYNLGAGGLTLSNENASSTAGNRILGQINGSITLAGGATNPNTGAVLIYDGTSTRWRVFASNQTNWTVAITTNGGITDSGGITISGSRAVLSSGAARIADTATGPTLTSCGSTPSPSVTVGEGKFTITTGGSATGCIATFATAFTNVPTCTVTPENGVSVAYSRTAAAVTLATGTAATAVYDVDCTDH